MVEIRASGSNATLEARSDRRLEGWGNPLAGARLCRAKELHDEWSHSPDRLQRLLENSRQADCSQEGPNDIDFVGPSLWRTYQDRLAALLNV